ncbi:MAG: hypothetical protein JO022_04575, partial [Acidobacteriaceae bacterium]|nr:hypothetical protein [Acidobacteriaceae bacterium]
MYKALASLLLFASVTLAQETQLGSDLRREGQELAKDCTNFKGFFGCAQTLFTGEPLHVSVGSLAPQNGVAFGPGFTFAKNLGENWRTTTSADAVVSTNQSWRAGIYFKAFYKPQQPIKVVTAPPAKKMEVAPGPVPTFNLYAQGISLNNIDYYGLGNFTPRSGEAVFGLTETIAGGNVIYPIFGNSGLALFGELNGRIFDPRGRTGQPAPSLPFVYPTDALAPGQLRSM